MLNDCLIGIPGCNIGKNQGFLNRDCGGKGSLRTLGVNFFSCVSAGVDLNRI
jgi:hypothetical protein